MLWWRGKQAMDDARGRLNRVTEDEPGEVIAVREEEHHLKPVECT
jgi:hypothetical protein